MEAVALQLDQKPYGYIYKITNLVNSKVYVGRTASPVRERWLAHCRRSSSKSSTLFQKDISKYGKEKFKVETVDSAAALRELKVKEAEWMARLSSRVPDGYNVMPGRVGHDFEGKTRISDDTIEKRCGNRFRVYSKDGVLIGEFVNITRCAEALGVLRSSVSYWLAGKLKSLRYDFVRVDKDTGELGCVTWGAETRVQVYKKDGSFVGEYINKTECAKALGVNLVDVSRWTLGKVKSRKFNFKLVEKSKVVV